ncbi:Lysophospholipase NTE1 [Apiospora hydei]|uniref:Lysophospholipase NTE1 n=1 Tax=Apiospora hydei TaxID=1337664 RepID=A0ABR1W8F5_9PEZI
MASSQTITSASQMAAKALSTAAVHIDRVASENSSFSWLGLIGRIILFIIHVLSTILYWSLKLTTISFPTLLFQLFSTSLTVTMNATTLLLIISLVVSGVTWVVRYRYLNMYSRLPHEPQRKEPDLDLPPDSHDEDSKPGLTNYLDEFLSAIKIFGYLERPVFHELTRSMQTRKLIAGETLNLEEEKGFCLVVDGLVEIFVKSSNRGQRSDADMVFGPDSLSGEDEEQPVPGQQRYQLLTEVRNGAPMSSLFSIMSLFTEDVQLRLPADESSTPDAVSGNQRFPPNVDLHPTRHDSGDLPSTPLSENGAKRTVLVQEPDRVNPGSPSSSAHYKIPHMSLDETPVPKRPKRPAPKRIATNSAHPDLRVTLATAYNYLGLTNEVLHTERHMLNYTTCQLPNHLRGDPLERLKEKFKREKERSGEEDVGKGIALHNATAHTRRSRSGAGLRRDATLHSMARARQTSVVASSIAPPQERSSIHTSGPGDLLANLQSARGGGSRGTVEIPVMQHWQPTESFAAPDETPLGSQCTDVGCGIEARGRDCVFPQGSVLVEQGERSPGVYYVIDGFLDICVPSEDTGSEILGSSSKTSLSAMQRADSATTRTSLVVGAGKEGTATGHIRPQSKMGTKASRRSVGLVKPGGLAGYIGTVSSYRSFVDVVAKTDVYVGFVPRALLERIVERYPIVLLTMAKRLTNLLPRLILHIDFALEWVQVSAGQVLFHKDEESEAIYLVLNGRLRLIEDKKDGGMSVRAEFGQGDSVGELEVLTESARTGTLHSIRDTELVKFPRTLFNSLAQEHPNITIKISKIIASRMRNLVDDPSQALGKDPANGTSINKISSTLNLRTVAILPVTTGVPVVEFGNRLMNALSQVGPSNGATSLNQSAILNHLGKHAFNKMGKLKLAHYLADLEEKYGLVVYVADTNVNSPWTQTCITQADCILLVGLAEGSPEIGEYERFMLGQKSTARKILVLLHADRFSPPGLTRSWLRNRVWINGGHYHVQMAFRTNAVPVQPSSRRIGATLKARVQILQAEISKYTSRKMRHEPYYSPESTYKGDFHRLARRLCGKSIGLVLGGGGARGIAQVGIIRAMEEAGIPIDIVGGTSIGSFIGALYARHADVVPMFGLSKKFSGRMASMWRFALDLTYPSASYTTGHEFNRGIFKTFGNHQIEDFWLEYYCNTTNISKSRGEIHTSGYAWRYVRASMSLAGLIPPLCDEGSMLLDGGYIDNLTVSHMKSIGADVIFAIDVGALDNDTPQTYGDSLSGAWAFFNRWNPFSTTPNPPTLAEIQGRLAYVSSVDALERAKTMPGCIYMRPPIDDYGTLDFGKFDEIYAMGHKFGQEFLNKLREDGVLPAVVEETAAKAALRRTMAPRRASI